MEKVLTGEEKIRRAEEIYQRRRNGYGYARDNRVTTVNVNQGKDYGLLKKMILQIAICLVIYFIFYLIQNSNYIFSEEVLTKTKQILSYDIDVVSLYEETVNFISNQMAGFAPNEASSQNEILNLTQNEQENENLVQETNGVGGVEPDTTFIEEALATTQEEIPQTDEEYIKNHFSFIKPIEGIVSSEFGKRDSQNPIVSKNHTGIDIAANTGTVIKASMEGTVSISSTQGDYGYHIKIVNGDVSTLYAHCSKLYVNQGDIITQGQEIGEVGTTGKSTGPHLHFEIMRGQNYINPRSILEF